MELETENRKNLESLQKRKDFLSTISQEAQATFDKFQESWREFQVGEVKPRQEALDKLNKGIVEESNKITKLSEELVKSLTPVLSMDPNEAIKTVLQPFNGSELLNK